MTIPAPIGGASASAGAPWPRVRRAWRRHGTASFLRLCLYNLRLAAVGGASRHDYVHDDKWDRAHGVETAGVVEVDEMAAPAAEKREAVRYEATPPECFDYLIEAADAGRPDRLGFIDIGSGKGRVVLMAALAGFRKTIGVEMGAELHAAAAANLERMRPKLGAAQVELLLGDARLCPLDPEPTLCFLNNPFGAALLEDLLERIEASLGAAPRPFTIVYYHSNHARLLTDRPGWRLVAEGWWRDESHHYCICRWTG